MLNEQCEYVWKFLRKNNFDDTAGNITNGMRCTICKKVMINAQIGECGCRYCLGCVTDYLNGGNRFCPGNRDDCKQELMMIDETVLFDYAMNQKISRLIVKCPRVGCEFTGELGRMEKHEEACGKHVTKCPYCDIGCLERPFVRDEIIGHLTDDNEFHATLLMHFISNLRNENRLMKEEILSLRSAIEKSRVMTFNVSLIINVLQTDYEERIPATDRDISEMRIQEQTQAAEIEQLQEKYHLLEEKLNDQKRKAEWDRNIDNIREKQLRCDNVATRVRNKWLNVENRYSGEFVWCIGQWAAIARAIWTGHYNEYAMFSESFYLHEQGYRMCLSVKKTNFNDCLQICWCLVRGLFDEYLSWPFKGTVILSLIDQQTRLDYTRYRLSHDQNSTDNEFDRPTSDRNNACLSNIIYLHDFCHNRAVCRNDQILIRCVVKMHG